MTDHSINYSFVSAGTISVNVCAWTRNLHLELLRYPYLSASNDSIGSTQVTLLDKNRDLA